MAVKLVLLSAGHIRVWSVDHQKRGIDGAGIGDVHGRADGCISHLVSGELDGFQSLTLVKGSSLFQREIQKVRKPGRDSIAKTRNGESQCKAGLMDLQGVYGM